MTKIRTLNLYDKMLFFAIYTTIISNYAQAHTYKEKRTAHFASAWLKNAIPAN